MLKYKLRDYKTVLFSKHALPKVIDTLKYNRINFEIFGTFSKNTYDNNTYDLIRRNAYEYLDKEKRIEILISKIENMSNYNIDKLLYYLEEFKYE